jgi:tetratricopeptide (TPR) repeat protein
MPLNDLNQLRDHLDKYQRGLGEYAGPLSEAGFAGDRLQDISPRLLLHLSIPVSDWGALLAAVAAFPVQPPAAAPSTAVQAENIGFAAQMDWVPAVYERWPSPIASEYHDLWAAVASNRIVEAVWQLKDFAEVLIKFSALVLATDVLANGSLESRNVVRNHLFGRPLSFGAWVGFLRVLAGIVAREKDRLAFPQVLEPFFTIRSSGEPVASGLYRALSEIVEFRNEAFGHGAFRTNLREFADDVTQLVRPLNQALRVPSAINTWSEIVLRMDGANGHELTGWQEVQKLREASSGDHQHQTRTIPLFVTKGTQELPLWPLIGFRICDRCGKFDVFFYDSRSAVSDAADFILLDYLAGHRMKRKPHQEPDLTRAAENISFQLLDDSNAVGEDYGRADFENLLLAKSSAARYLRPDYLHAPLTSFVTSNSKGVFWLSAPGHTGKTVFVRGLTDPEHRKQVEKSVRWLADAALCRFAIKREIQYTIQELLAAIRHQILEGRFGLREKEKPFPQLDLSSKNPPDAFATYLAAISALRPVNVDRIVLFIDGLDELRPAGATGLERFLPRAESLPPGVYLVLTSRPARDCPEFVRDALRARNYGSSVESRHVELQFDSDDEVATGYRALLGEYYRRESGLWKGERSGGGEPLDATFDLIYAKAGGRFAFVAFLTDLVVRKGLEPEELAALPAEDKDSAEGAGFGAPSKLYAWYLADLAQVLSAGPDSTKHWDFVRRILVSLAADEEAHAAEMAAVKEVLPEDPYRGMSLEAIADRLNEPAITYKLVSAIYAFQPLLAAWKEDSAEATRYGLGLKELTPTLRALYPGDIDEEHQRVADSEWPRLDIKLRDLVDSSEEMATRQSSSSIRYLSHTYAIGKATYSEEVWTRIYLVSRVMDARRRERLALRVDSLAIFTAEAAKARVDSNWTPEQDNALAATWLRRAGSRRILGDISGAISDCGHAISLWKPISESVAPPSVDVELASAYCYRANIRDLGDQNSLADLDRAIELYQRVAASASENLQENSVISCADAHLSRANNREAAQDHRGAVEDVNRACEMLDRVWAKRDRISLDVGKKVAASYAHAVLQRAELEKMESNPRAAERDEDKALAIFQTLKTWSGDAWNSACRQQRAQVLLHRARSRWDAGSYRGAIEDADEAIKELYVVLSDPPDISFDAAEHLLLAFLIRARSLSRMNDLPGALADYDRMIKLGAAEISDMFRQTHMYDERAQLRLMNQDPMGAIQDAERAISLLRQWKLDTSGLAAWGINLARCFTTQASAWSQLGDTIRAAKTYDTAILELEKIMSRISPHEIGDIQQKLSELRRAKSELGI